MAKATYDMPGVGFGQGVLTFDTLPKESTVSIKITDDAGLGAWAFVSQDVDGDGSGVDEGQWICGQTTEPIEIKGGITLYVSIFPGPCLMPAPGLAFATQGTVVARFLVSGQ